MEIKIKIKIKDVEIELTTEEAKELSGILAGLTGEKGVMKYYPWYSQPYTAAPWIYTSPSWTTTTTEPYKITCAYNCE